LRVARNTQLVAGNKQLAARNMMLVARNSCAGVNAALVWAHPSRTQPFNGTYNLWNG